MSVLVLALFSAFHFIAPNKPLVNLDQLSALDLLTASLLTIYRLLIAYLLSMVFSIPLALLATASPKMEKIFLPIFDITQSIPALAFFPIVVLIFIRVNYFEGATIFILFMAMLWNLVFTMIGGLRTIPEDINSAAIVYKASFFKKLRYVTLPAILPYVITGSLLAWAQGWNIIIVAEVIHNYIPGGNASQDLFGLGSLLVNASYYGKNSLFLASIVVMTLIIGLLDLFVWQKLLNLAERYKFD